jgi:hypothetical protein
MDQYEPATHRALFVVVAFAIMATLFGIFVFAPTRLPPETPAVRAMKEPIAEPADLVEVTIIPSEIVVVGEREDKTALQRNAPIQPRTEAQDRVPTALTVPSSS